MTPSVGGESEPPGQSCASSGKAPMKATLLKDQDGGTLAGRAVTARFHPDTLWPHQLRHAPISDSPKVLKNAQEGAPIFTPSGTKCAISLPHPVPVETSGTPLTRAVLRGDSKSPNSQNVLV